MPPPNTDFTAVAAGWNHSIGLKSDGSIVGWGWNYYGQATPPSGNDFIAIAAGEYYSLALKSDSSIIGWGYDGFGQATPPSGNDFTAITAGARHGLALKEDGSIVGWGRNTDGQASPPAGYDFIAIAAGWDYGLALKNDSSIVAWGYNYYGQCNVPEPNTGFVAIEGGFEHSLGLKSDGSIVGWGNNQYGQASPPDGNDFIAIAAGGFHNLAIGSITTTPGDWDVNDGCKMHWPQLPDMNDTSMDVSMFRAPLGDDFNCIETGPITDIYIWGSFLDDMLPALGLRSLTFRLTIYADIPADGDSWSRPGESLWSKVFSPSDPNAYTVRQLDEEVWQDWYDPNTGFYEANNHKLTFQYHFKVEGKESFRQYKGNIFWLVVEDITQVASRGYEFGWKTTGFNLRWNDDAAFWRSQPPPGWYPLEYPPTHQYDGNSLDLAFAINCRLPEANGPMACADLGDAPDSTNSWDVPPMTAYPPGGPPGVEANFPTVYRAGSPPYGPIHWEPLSAYLGGGVTREGEADIGDDDDVINNIIPPTDLPDLDEFDDGVIFPLFLPNGVQTNILVCGYDCRTGSTPVVCKCVVRLEPRRGLGRELRMGSTESGGSEHSRGVCNPDPAVYTLASFRTTTCLDANHAFKPTVVPHSGRNRRRRLWACRRLSIWRNGGLLPRPYIK